MNNRYCVFYFIFFVTCVFNSLFGFDFHEFDTFQYKLTHDEVQQKIKNYLEKDPEIKKFYKLTPQALYIGDLENYQIEYVLNLSSKQVHTKKHSRKNSLKGVKVAIDPGHFGGSLAELEARYIMISEENTKHGQPIYFCEGDLTYLTALKLQSLLESEGADVLVTRDKIGQGVFKEDFFTWMESHSDLNDSSTSLSKIFRKYYNREDLLERANKINAFSPDITVVIHYNTHLSYLERTEGAFFTQSNYNLAFIPGAFGSGELKGKGAQYEFLRLIVTDCIEESLKLSRCIVSEFVDQLQIPLIEEGEKTSYIDSACIFQEPGVYCRNLALTRLIHSPICYGETLVQNNEEEAYRLSSHDISIMGIPCSKRVEEVANAYFKGIKKYFKHRKY